MRGLRQVALKIKTCDTTITRTLLFFIFFAAQRSIFVCWQTLAPARKGIPLRPIKYTVMVLKSTPEYISL